MRRTLSLYITCLLALLATAPKAYCKKNKPEFVYDLNFAFNFDNREYDKSGYQNSGTIFGARLSPYIGFNYNSGKFSHKIMAGIDLVKDFGDSQAINKELFHEMSLWYNFSTKCGKGNFDLNMGIFPRNKMEESWSSAFFSDKVLWYDNNFEGLMMQWEGKRYRYELGCDWMGEYGSAPFTREQFMIMTAGHHDISHWLTLGYNAYMVHYANSAEVRGVVDNILAEPYVKINFEKICNGCFQEFKVHLGHLNSLQRDRLIHEGYLYNSMIDLGFAIQKWNVRISTNQYFGNNIMPLYHEQDAGGFVYGEDLYRGDAFFMVHGGSSYGRTQISYLPRIGKGVELGVSYVLHYHKEGFSGSQQLIRLSVNLGEMFSKKK